MAGAAVTTALEQLKGLLNVTHFTSETDFISIMKSVLWHIDEWNWRPTALGLAFLGFLNSQILGQKKKKLFWVPAIAPLSSAILSTLFVFLTIAAKHGAKIVGHVKKRIDPVSACQCFRSGYLAAAGPKIGLIASLIGLTEGVAIRRAFAALRDHHIDGNGERIAFGVMNLRVFYITSGILLRSAVKYQAGANREMLIFLMSIVVLITLLLLTPLLKYTPTIILSVITISAVLSPIDVRAAQLVRKIDEFDFLACLGAFVGVSVEIGLLVAVCFSFVKLLFNVARRGTVVTNVYRNVTQYPTAALVPGILSIRVDAVIYFSNSNSIQDKSLHNLEEYTKKLAETEALFQYLLVDSTPDTNIDTSGKICRQGAGNDSEAKELTGTSFSFTRTMCKSLYESEKLAFANPGTLVISQIDEYKFFAHLGSEWFTVSEAIQVCAMLLNQDAAERRQV